MGLAVTPQVLLVVLAAAVMAAMEMQAARGLRGKGIVAGTVRLQLGMRAEVVVVLALREAMAARFLPQ